MKGETVSSIRTVKECACNIKQKRKEFHCEIYFQFLNSTEIWSILYNLIIIRYYILTLILVVIAQFNPDHTLTVIILFHRFNEMYNFLVFFLFLNDKQKDVCWWKKNRAKGFTSKKNPDVEWKNNLANFSNGPPPNRPTQLFGTRPPALEFETPSAPTVFLRIRLPSTRSRRFKAPKTKVFKYALQGGDFFLSYSCGRAKTEVFKYDDIMPGKWF